MGAKTKTMEETTYIPHSIINSIYIWRDPDKSIWIIVRTKTEGTYKTFDLIFTNANGITGKFKKL